MHGRCAEGDQAVIFGAGQWRQERPEITVDGDDGLDITIDVDL